MINFYKLRKWISYIVLVVIPANALLMGNVMMGLIPGMALFALFAGVSIFISNSIMKHPFTDVLEGNGLLVIPIDSTGISHPLIVGMDGKTNKLRGKDKRIGNVEDYFDRETGMSMAAPVKSEKVTAEIKEDGLEITDNSGNEEVTAKLSFNEFGKYRFGLNQYPVLFWNKELNSFLTKEQVSDFEKETLSLHPLYRLNVETNDMAKDVRDLSRGIVDVSLKPEKKSFVSSPLMIVIIVVMIVIFAFLIIPKLMPQLAGSIEGLIPK